MANNVLYGFQNLQDIKDQVVTPELFPVLTEALDQAVEEHNRQMDALKGLFVEETTEYKLRFKQVQGGRLQPLDENGRARPVKSKGFYDLAWPMHSAGTADGFNFLTGEKRTVADVEQTAATNLLSDLEWMRDHILAALFVNTSWTHEDEKHGELTIQPLANNDATVYFVTTGASAGTTANHFLAQAAAISDAANPFQTIYDTLRVHPENSGQIIALIPTNQKSAVQNLAGFVDKVDENIRPGANQDVLLGMPDVDLPGELIGYDKNSRVWICEWKSLPNDYIISVSMGGRRPLRQRVDPERALRGFKRVAERNDYPYFENQWLRRAGFGAYNRVAALVYRIGNAAYAVPTGYNSPMP